MKKALAMALGAVLVAGSAAPASAASQVDFSGFYGAHYAVNGNLGYTGDNNLNESFFENRFNVNVKFQATDEVSVVWRFRAPRGNRWNSGNTDVASGNRSMSSHYYYGQVVQDWGTVRVGRLSAGLANQFGLISLGWAPSLDDEFTAVGPFDSAAEADSIQYANKWDNGFSLATTYSKITDGFTGNWDEADGSDHDADRFQIQGAYQWETGGAALNVMYERDATGNSSSLGRGNDGAQWGVDPDTGKIVIVTPGLDIPSFDGREDKTTVWYINPAIMQSWGAFSVHAEAMFAFGTTEYYNTGLRPAEIENYYMDDTDVEGQGFYLDFDYNYGPGRVNLAGWWVSGNDIEDQNNDDNKDKSAAKIVNGNFYPLVVAYGPVDAYYAGTSTDGRRDAVGAVGVANAGSTFIDTTAIISRPTGTTYANLDAFELAMQVIDPAFNAPGYINRTPAFDNGDANHWALMISGQHAFTDEVTFNYALAYMALNNPNYEVLDRGYYDGTGNDARYSYVTQDKDLGWEIDLGVNVQLLDNLAFTSTVGYMFTGDAYKQLQGYRVTNPTGNEYSVQAVWEDADDAYSWLNSLIFSF